MPVNYLEYIHFEFSSGMVWEVDIKEQLKTLSSDVVAERLQETIREYRSEVKRFDFKLDVARLKRDIKKSTKAFF